MELSAWLLPVGSTLLSVVVGAVASMGTSWWLDHRRRKHETEKQRVESLREAAVTADRRLVDLESLVYREEIPKQFDAKQEVRAIFLLLAPWVKDWDAVRDEMDQVSEVIEDAVRDRVSDQALGRSSGGRAVMLAFFKTSVHGTDYALSPAIREFFISLARSPEDEAEAIHALSEARRKAAAERKREAVASADDEDE